MWVRVRVIALSILLALSALSCSNPPDDPPVAAETASLAHIDKVGLSALRDSFNTSADRARILVMLSPT